MMSAGVNIPQCVISYETENDRSVSIQSIIFSVVYELAQT
jgi:hypothetical protein